MPSTFKTNNLGLNSWIETDKPTRSDFVGDNMIIDNKLGSHIQNKAIHLTNEEKLRVTSPYTVKLLQGTDESTRKIDLDYEPSIIIMFAVDTPPMIDVNGVSSVCRGAAVNRYNSSGGLYINGSSVTVCQGERDGVSYNLNNSEYQYVLIIFR